MEAHVRKLGLNVRELKVETFELAHGAEMGGTVYAILETQRGQTCVTQCATGPCECIITYPSCEYICE
ncbi:hypothetical protein FHS01_000296 [Longimicrobium terrae]|uniref:Uncharacterized protein n=1 Tax=Longimicrobium terrae TaxID=1639882 RepID=A0A841GPF3_9BACT|nr:hypothetical protein [Longimicrobium terrae]MBB6068820.1 hypothetical protein [Longimicrobium terrae]